MTIDTWIDAMVKDIESKKSTNEETQTVKLSENDMNALADIMIKKMSESNFDAETSEEDKKKEETNQPKPDASGEIPIE